MDCAHYECSQRELYFILLGVQLFFLCWCASLFLFLLLPLCYLGEVNSQGLPLPGTAFEFPCPYPMEGATEEGATWLARSNFISWLRRRGSCVVKSDGIPCGPGKTALTPTSTSARVSNVTSSHLLVGATSTSNTADPEFLGLFQELRGAVLVL